MADFIEARLDVRSTIAALERLKAVSQKKSLRAAGNAGARVWLKLAKAKVQVRSGLLKSDLRIRRRFNYEGAQFSVGTSKNARHAHLVELGTAPHYIPTPKGSPFSPPGGGINHPGSRPYPFLRPAFHEGRSQALRNVAKNLLRVIKRETAKGRTILGGGLR